SKKPGGLRPSGCRPVLHSSPRIDIRPRGRQPYGERKGTRPATRGPSSVTRQRVTSSHGPAPDNDLPGNPPKHRTPVVFTSPGPRPSTGTPSSTSTPGTNQTVRSLPSTDSQS